MPLSGSSRRRRWRERRWPGVRALFPAGRSRLRRLVRCRRLLQSEPSQLRQWSPPPLLHRAARLAAWPVPGWPGVHQRWEPWGAGCPPGGDAGSGGARIKFWIADPGAETEIHIVPTFSYTALPIWFLENQWSYYEREKNEMNGVLGTYYDLGSQSGTANLRRSHCVLNPDRNLDHPQNIGLMAVFGSTHTSYEVSCKSVQSCWQTDRKTNKQTNKHDQNIASFGGGANRMKAIINITAYVQFQRRPNDFSMSTRVDCTWTIVTRRDHTFCW